MLKSKKVIFLAPLLAEGGGERVISELSLNLPENIEKVFVLFERKVDYPYKGRLISLDILFPKNFFLKLFCLIKAIFKFRKILKEEKPDWVISLGKMPNIINVLTNNRAIVREDVYLSVGYDHLLGKMYKTLVKIFFNKRAKFIVAVSRGVKEDLIENYGIKREKIKLIYNLIDIEKVKKLAQEPLDLEHQEIFKKPVIINIGRLNRQKGQWHLIRAFSELRKKKEARLVILGEGWLEGYLKDLAKDLNIDKDVIFLGWQKNPFKFLGRSGILVLSSIWEGLGMVLLEAMICGVPIISTNCPMGPGEVLYPDNGILIPQLKPELLGAKNPPTREEKIMTKEMLKVLKEKPVSLIENSYRKVETFRAENIIKEWSFLWEE